MSSTDLRGFSDWQKWNSNVIHKAPARQGAYAFRLVGDGFGRFKGVSDLIYIGCAAKGTILGRLRTHLSSRIDALDVATRINDPSKGNFEVAWKILGSPQEAKQEEAKLLRHYYKDHCELPPDNHSAPEKKMRRAVECLDLSHAEAEELIQNLSENKAASST